MSEDHDPQPLETRMAKLENRVWALSLAVILLAGVFVLEGILN